MICGFEDLRNLIGKKIHGLRGCRHAFMGNAEEWNGKIMLVTGLVRILKNVALTRIDPKCIQIIEMKTKTINGIFTIMILFFLQSGYGQTFNTYDSFSKKNGTNEVKVGGYIIINFRSELNNDTITVSGKIIERDTKFPIPGISIREKVSNNTAVTNLNGEFNLQSINKKSKLIITGTGFNSEEIVIPTPIKEKTEANENSLTSFSGLFLANLGAESTIQPNIMLSQGWRFGRNSVELRIMGLQNNKDTAQLANGLNLIKPEFSKINFRITGDFVPVKQIDKLSINAEINIFKQQLNFAKQDVQTGDISSLLIKFSTGYRPAPGLHFYATGVLYSVFEGVQLFENRFGSDATKNFWNFELSGKFAVSGGPLEGTFIQASLNINTDDYKKLINTKDAGVFLIRLGFNKEIIK